MAFVLGAATLTKTPDGAYLIELPRSMHVNPNTFPKRDMRSPGHVARAENFARGAINAFSDTFQVSTSLVGLKRW
jgi:hypothetical protein